MLLFSYAKKRIPVKAAAFVGLVFAFNPAVLVTGSAWGQVDSLLALLLLIAAMQAIGEKVAQSRCRCTYCPSLSSRRRCCSDLSHLRG